MQEWPTYRPTLKIRDMLIFSDMPCLCNTVPVNSRHTSVQGRPSPLRQWCIFPPDSDFPLFLKIFSNSAENFPNLTFSKNVFRFSSTEISDDLFLFIHHKFRFPTPLFPCVFNSFPPYFGKFFFSPTFAILPPDFVKFTCFYILYMYFVSPLLLPFMQNTMHVLDALASSYYESSVLYYNCCVMHFTAFFSFTTAFLLF